MNNTVTKKTRDYVNTSKVTRVEIIDHTPCDECEGEGWVAVPDKNGEAEQAPCIGCQGMGIEGRTVVVHNKGVQVDLELQDNERTLKVFIHERYSE